MESKTLRVSLSIDKNTHPRNNQSQQCNDLKRNALPAGSIQSHMIRIRVEHQMENDRQLSLLKFHEILEVLASAKTSNQEVNFMHLQI
jgi:hypothetical protein